MGVVIQAVDNSEPGTQRGRDQSDSCCSANQSKVFQIETMGAGTGALPDYNVELIIFHCGIENLFDVRLQAVNLVDKEDVRTFKVRQNRGQVTLDLYQWARRRTEIGRHFVRYN